MSGIRTHNLSGDLKQSRHTATAFVTGNNKWR
jgi:hypothetical protein